MIRLLLRGYNRAEIYMLEKIVEKGLQDVTERFCNYLDDSPESCNDCKYKRLCKDLGKTLRFLKYGRSAVR